MRGKQIEYITLDDINQLIADGVPEGRLLEFKIDIPVSNEEQKLQRKNDPNIIRPVNRSWIKGEKLPDYGRDSLAEEIAAFANADGGTLILGMDETKEAPPRAKEINALPDVAGLERRLRDVLADCIEPRLPYVSVRAVPTASDGSGIVLIQTSASALGPHWVVKTRRPTIRREDRCDSLTMSEVHDMVLRNARNNEAMTKQLDLYRSRFPIDFEKHLRSIKPTNFIGDSEGLVGAWLRSTNQSALGAQVVIMPHYDLGIQRLEDLIGLMPSGTSIGIEMSSGVHSTFYVDTYTFSQSYAEKILGGAHAKQHGGFTKSVKVLRNGQIIVSFMQVRDPYSCTCSADLIVGLAGFALGVFDRLRARSNYSSAPLDLAIDICTRETVGVGSYPGIGNQSSYGKLDDHVSFPIYTAGSSDDISTVLQEIAADLMNAGGMPSGHLPKVVWNDPH